MVAGFAVRADERQLVLAAGGVFALASAGAAMTAAAADAMFLADVGPSSLGAAVAASNALLAVVLAVVGALADRFDRQRVLAALAVISAVAVAALGALSIAAPRAAAITALIGGKQLAAATDLAFWVAIAERMDARRSQRVLPMLAAAGGIGAAIGAGVVVAIAAIAGARGVLFGAALALAAAGALGSRWSSARTVVTATAPTAPTSVRRLVARAWRDGAAATRRSPLARSLALAVALAGAFASLMYFALGVAASAHGGSVADLAELLGGIRAAAQLVTVIAQVALAQRLLAWIGTGRALAIAPAAGVVAGLGLVAAPVLAVAIAAQMSARILDASVETPAEKLAQTLLPTAVRGRIAGFLDGTAKRVGAIAGGLLAMALAGAPAAFYASTAIVAVGWWLVARHLARELPALALARLADAAVVRDADATVDATVVAAVARELAGARPERAAEVLVRVHDRGRADATAALLRAVAERAAPVAPAMWRAAIAVLDHPLPPPLARELAEPLARAALADGSELAIRAAGLAGCEVTARPRSDGDPARALAARIAALRHAGDREAIARALADAIRDDDPLPRAALEELAAELARAVATGGARDGAHVLAIARALVRGLARRRGTASVRAAGWSALARALPAMAELAAAHGGELALWRADVIEAARERVDAAASAAAPVDSLVSLQRSPRGQLAAATAGADAAEVAAALRALGAWMVTAGALVTPAVDDLRRLARALAEPDDDLRAAAESCLRAVGAAAAGELVETVGWGRRLARDRAAALLAELPVTPAALDQLIAGELAELERTARALAALGAPDARWLARRLDERLREVAHTVLLLAAARGRSPAIARAAHAWRHAVDRRDRARALAVVEAALPRAIAQRLVATVDDLTPIERASAFAAAGVAVPARDHAERDELAGRDRLARALVLHTASAERRAAHRETIASAARSEADAMTADALLRRIAQRMATPVRGVGESSAGALATIGAGDDDRADMPTRVETLIALGHVPLFAALTTRQLADVAERAGWHSAPAGQVVVAAGEPLDALIVVDTGELELAGRAITAGAVVDELACVAPIAAAADLVVARAARWIRLERADFEQLVDDVPGLAAAICRALGERARAR